MKKSSEKSFGIVFSVVFLIISFWPLLDGNQLRLPWLIASVILLFPQNTDFPLLI